MLEDRQLELLQPVSRIEPELVGEEPPAPLVLVEGLRLAAAPVEGQHQLAAETLPQRMLPHEPFELRHELGVESELEVGVDPPLEREQTLLLQLRPLRASKRVAKIRERLAAPQRERLPQRLGGLRRIAPIHTCHQLFEAHVVELLRVNLDDVAGSTSDDGVPTECLAQLGDVDLKRCSRGFRWRRVPELVDQAIAWDDPVCVQQQEREQRPLLRAAERNVLPAVENLERAENAELQALLL